ncbi:phosphomevalonate kinase [Fopius arisanus]|uniref:Phosphomevalonate kinase n=1 Tax=Fopius arisanus TaxID=64838 RepID=A0A0C9RL29_9HYME|nr:PREDICTED: phosphomevalonate kinase [Fopius arisanus]
MSFNMADVSESSARLPESILLFSGKRKSGKDYITNKLFDALGSDFTVIIKISGPIKSHWAKSRNLDLDRLLSDGEYKEKYRLEMIKWGEDRRRQDHGYFCRAAIDMYNARGKRIWIVSDVRRKTDVQWFRDNFPGKCRGIRINCTNETRERRGWRFTPGVDDCETECDLDDIEDWDLTINNEGETSEDILKQLLHLIEQR